MYHFKNSFLYVFLFILDFSNKRTTEKMNELCEENNTKNNAMSNHSIISDIQVRSESLQYILSNVPDYPHQGKNQ